MTKVKACAVVIIILCSCLIWACGGSGSSTADPEPIIVDYMTAITPPENQRTLISLRSHDGIYFDMTLPNAGARVEILESMMQLGSPMYFEIDPESRLIAEYLFTSEGQVVKLEPDDEGTLVHFTTSAAIHILFEIEADYSDLLALLEQALQDQNPVLWTSDMNDRNRIVDVRAPI